MLPHVGRSGEPLNAARGTQPALTWFLWRLLADRALSPVAAEVCRMAPRRHKERRLGQGLTALTSPDQSILLNPLNPSRGVPRVLPVVKKRTRQMQAAHSMETFTLQSSTGAAVSTWHQDHSLHH